MTENCKRRCKRLLEIQDRLNPMSVSAKVYELLREANVERKTAKKCQMELGKFIKERINNLLYDE